MYCQQEYFIEGRTAYYVHSKPRSQYCILGNNPCGGLTSLEGASADPGSQAVYCTEMRDANLVLAPTSSCQNVVLGSAIPGSRSLLHTSLGNYSMQTRRREYHLYVCCIRLQWWFRSKCQASSVDQLQNVALQYHILAGTAHTIPRKWLHMRTYARRMLPGTTPPGEVGNYCSQLISPMDSCVCSVL